jgi:hypothetical protein
MNYALVRDSLPCALARGIKTTLLGGFSLNSRFIIVWLRLVVVGYLNPLISLGVSCFQHLQIVILVFN